VGDAAAHQALLRAEVWRRRCETAGFRVVLEPWAPAAQQRAGVTGQAAPVGSCDQSHATASG